MAPNEVSTGTKGRARPSSTTKKVGTSAVATPQQEKRPVTVWLNTASVFDPEAYLKVISELSGLNAEDIIGDRRWATLIKPRHLFYACLRSIGGWSFPEIGDYVGRHHTTIMSAVTKVPADVINDVRDLVEKSSQSKKANPSD
jgi:chromosomal replication initiation ATPase DnaA